MDGMKRVMDYAGTHPDKFYKTTLFQTDSLLLGLNCLQPGQVQSPHTHADQTKFYYVVEGEGLFWLGEEQMRATAGTVVWAAAGLVHGVQNAGNSLLVLLVGIAPANHVKK